MLLCVQAALLTLGICGCSQQDLNAVEGEIPTPNSQYKAVVFQRKAESLRGATRNVSIVRYGQPLQNDIGNAYSAGINADGSQPKIWVNWRDNQNMQIFRDPKAHCYREDKHVSVLTGIFIQTADFGIGYGDYSVIEPAEKAATSNKKSVVTKQATKHKSR